MAAEVGDLIQAVAEGATGSVRAMRGAGLSVGMGAFDVEVDYVRPDGGPGEISATLRVRLTVSAESEPPDREVGPGPAVIRLNDSVLQPS